MKIEPLIDRIRRCSDLDKSSDDQILLFIAEEVGEVATCLAVKNGLKKRELKEPVESECCDIIINCVALILRNEKWDSEKILKTMSKKLEKWEKRVANPGQD